MPAAVATSGRREAATSRLLRSAARTCGFVGRLDVPVEGEAVPRAVRRLALKEKATSTSDRRVEEEVDERALHRPREPRERAGPRPPQRLGRRPQRPPEEQQRSTTTARESRNERAAPKGMSRATANWLWMRLPTYAVLPPPRRSGAR